VIVVYILQRETGATNLASKPGHNGSRRSISSTRLRVLSCWRRPRRCVTGGTLFMVLSAAKGLTVRGAPSRSPGTPAHGTHRVLFFLAFIEGIWLWFDDFE
jgi:hypothetical protein